MTTTIASLPIESLTQIFTLLSPNSLVQIAKVSTEWRDIIADDSIWRTAFENHFGMKDRSGSVTLGRRLDPLSWRDEYMKRTALIITWSKSRSLANVVSVPKDRDQDFEGGPIDAIHLNYPDSLDHDPASPHNPSKLLVLAISCKMGRAAIFSPFPRHFARPLSHFYLNDLSDRLRRTTTAPRYTSYAISNDGSHLIWGMSDGSIRMVYTGMRRGGEGRGIEGSNNVKIRSRDRMIEGHRRDGGQSVGDCISVIAFDQYSSDEAGGSFVSAEGAPTVLSGVGKRKVVIWKTVTPRLDAPFALSMWERAIPTPILADSTSPTRYTTPIASTLLFTPPRLDVPTPAPAIPPTFRLNRLILESQSLSLACKVAFSSYSSRIAENGSTQKVAGSRRGVVALGMNNGDVHVWIGIRLDERRPSESDDAGGEERYYCLAAEQDHDREEDDRHIDPNSFFLRPIDTLLLDTSTSAETNSIQLLVHRFNDKVFHRYTFALDSTSPSNTLALLTALSAVKKATFGHGEELGVITCLVADFSPPPLVPSAPSAHSSTSVDDVDDDIDNAREEVHDSSRSTGINSFGRTKFVVTGDDQGRASIWNWEEAIGDGELTIKPRRVIQTGDVKVTAIELGEGILFIGGLDGIIRAYDPLNSFLVRIFKDRTTNPRHSFEVMTPDEEAKCRVSHILSDRENVVASVGGKLMTWSIVAEIAAIEVKKKKKGKFGARGDRLTAEQELREQVLDSLSTLSNESIGRQDRRDTTQRITIEYGLPTSLNRMTEDEAVNLALMLSVEEEEERENWMSREDAMEGDDVDLDLDLDGWKLEDDDENDDRQAQSSRSLSIAAATPPIRRGSTSAFSPSPSPSRSFTFTTSSSTPSHRPASQRSSPYFGAHQSTSQEYSRSPQSNDKLQLSPRLRPTYGSFGRQEDTPIPDMSEELWPTAGSPSTSAFGSRKSTPITSTISTPLKRGWNDVVQSGTRSSIASSSPRTSALESSLTRSSPSLLSTQFGWTTTTAQSDRERQEEEELRFALELSLAEELSRAS